MMYQSDPFYEAESVGPQVTFGADPVPTGADASAQAKGEFYAKFGHDSPQNLEEANWLDARVKAIKAETGVTKMATVGGKTVELSPTPPSASWWGGMSTGGKVALAGGVGLGAIAMLMMRKRRANPRRNKLVPILVVGGVAVALMWGGKQTVAAVEEATPSPSPELTPAEQGGVIWPQ